MSEASLYDGLLENMDPETDVLFRRALGLDMDADFPAHVAAAWPPYKLFMDRMNAQVRPSDVAMLCMFAGLLPTVQELFATAPKPLDPIEIPLVVAEAATNVKVKKPKRVAAPASKSKAKLGRFTPEPVAG